MLFSYSSVAFIGLDNQAGLVNDDTFVFDALNLHMKEQIVIFPNLFF
jgi:hypothetical protein